MSLYGAIVLLVSGGETMSRTAGAGLTVHPHHKIGNALRIFNPCNTDTAGGCLPSLPGGMAGRGGGYGSPEYPDSKNRAGGCP